jgi:chromosome segregation protein
MEFDIFKNGSAWVKADFHLHTMADKEFKYTQSESDKEKKYDPKNTFPHDYIETLKKAGISVGVITNHNKFDKDEFSCLSQKAKKEQILLLPGVELGVNEGFNGVHTLIVFSEEWISDGNNFIALFLASAFLGQSPETYQNENGKTTKSLLEITALLDEYKRKYFIVFAHVEQNSGLWKECSGGKLCEWKKDAYSSLKKHTLAFQKVRTSDSRKKVQGWLGDWYPAEVEGSDCKSIADIGNKDGETWIKTGSASFEAVEYALIAHEDRVRSEEKKAVGHSYIESISYEGGVLNGKKILFSPELNTFIGIRGSGKSSVLETLRYVLNIQAGTDIVEKEYKTKLVSYVLGSGGKATVHAVDKFGQQYDVSRIYQDTPNVYVNDQLQQGISINETILTNPLYFGQKELAASSDAFGPELIEKLIGNKLTETRLQIEKQKQKIRDTVFSIAKDADIDEQIAENKKALEDAEFNLKKFSAAGIGERLQKQIDFDTDDRQMNKTTASIKTLRDELQISIQHAQSEVSETSGYTSVQNKELFDEINRIVNDVENSISLMNKQCDAISTALELLLLKQQAFVQKKKNAEDSFAEIRRSLEKEVHDSGAVLLNIEDFPKLKNKIALTKSVIAALELQRKNVDAKHTELLAQLDVLNELHRSEFNKIKQELSVINADETGITIDSGFKENKNAFIEYMKSIFRGTGLRESQYEKVCGSFPDFAAMYKDWETAKKIIGTNSELFAGTFEANLADLLIYRVPDKIMIKYQGIELQRHSLGQRASALILFILSRKESSVIIIDQPEDDLDNQTIYKDVIKLLKKVKPYMQCIVATHNANFPVLGDAEQIHACSFQKDAVTILSGSIDSGEMQRQVISVMEGGNEAFERRREIYQLWSQ